MRRGRLGAVVWAILLPCLITRPVSAGDSRDIEQALSRAKRFLYAQFKDGNWEKSPGQNLESQDKLTGSQWGGLTALATYALLAAGDNPNAEPRLSDAVTFLKRAKLTGTYALGIRCQVWLLLPQTPEIKSLMRHDAAALLAMMKTQGDAKGFYDYDARGKPTTYSLSRAQYAVLGMWAAAQAGVEIPTDYWRKVETAWIGHQDQTGGWNYQKGNRDYPLTAGMTAAGVATLFIAQDYVQSGAGKECTGNVPNPAVERGLQWLTTHFDRAISEKELPREYPFSTLYAVERVGVASGLKYFGDHDWYREGTDYLIAHQRPDGSWYARSSYFGPIPDTCFGILFLARGRAPLVMNKLRYGEPADAAAPAAQPARKPTALEVAKKLTAKPVDWNQRPRDVANLSRWIGTVAERELNWQVLGPEASLRDLHDAPILYVSGSNPIDFDAPLKARLKEYVEGGGLILANADCGGRQFANSIRALGTELFPGYAFRELPADHPMYTAGVFPRAKWKNKPQVLGLSNGVRELMLLIPQADVGRVWHSREVAARQEAWQLGADIFFYAAGRRDLRYRGESHLVLADEKVKATHSVSVARLQYAGNWDPEPGGWRRFANILHNQHKLDLALHPVNPGSQRIETEKVAHLTGTASFKLDERARIELRRFVEAGGLLVVDAAGGSAAFANAAEAEVKSIFPGAELASLPPDHVLFSAAGIKLEAVAYRPFAQKSLAGASKTPRLRAIVRGGRVAVILSREDLSAGLAGQPVNGIIGYDPQSATELMTRIILYAAPR